MSRRTPSYIRHNKHQLSTQTQTERDPTNEIDLARGPRSLNIADQVRIEASLLYCSIIIYLK